MMGNEVVVAEFNVLSRQLSGGTEENDEEPVTMAGLRSEF